jgi:hypothetical protein
MGKDKDKKKKKKAESESSSDSGPEDVSKHMFDKHSHMLCPFGYTSYL